MQISGIQTDVSLGDVAANMQKMETFVKSECDRGSRLIVFPECFATGYCFESLEEARSVAEPLDGRIVARATQLCADSGCYTAFGMLERDEERIFNASVIVGPDGLIGNYRKVHLPYLGVDRFNSYGEQPFEVFEVDGIRVGMLICYDGSFPEAVRILAILGADLVVLPTNWPPGAENMAAYASNTRAMENGIYFAAVNRVGQERGFSFIGQSRICDPSGNTLDSADHMQEAILRANIEAQRARQKRYVRVPGKHIIDRMADRRPEVYGPLCNPHSLPRPGRDNAD